MSLFDIFRRRPSFSSNRILTPEQVHEVLSTDITDKPDSVIFVCASTKPIMPFELMFMPFLQAKFSQDSSLGMIYGTGSGCALLSTTAIERVQALHRGRIKSITSCQDLIDSLGELGFTVRQDPMLSLDQLP